MSKFLLKHWVSLWLVIGAILINLALDYGLGVNFGWWGLAFWAGFGCILAALKADAALKAER